MLDLSGSELVAAPFLHAVLADCVPADAAERLLTWFETDAPWSLAETDFYEQWEFDMLAMRDERSDWLTSDDALERVRSSMGHLFGVRFGSRVTMVAHRLLPGQHIGIHNDHLEDGETHRVTIQFNRGLSDEDGGFLMTFNSDDARDVHSVLRPIHRTGFAFAISPCSFHAVSRMHGNERYTVVTSFYVDRD